MINKTYNLDFSNSNNVWYDIDSFYGSEIDMLKYANEKLNNKENKLYNLWIYDNNGNWMYRKHTIGAFRRGKKIEKLIQERTEIKD